MLHGFRACTWVYHGLWYTIYGVAGVVARRNVIRGVDNSRIFIEVVRASTYSAYDIGKRYSSTSDGRGMVRIASASST